MKKLCSFLFLVFLFSGISAQYCGSPDTLGCTTASIPDSVGLYPRPEFFPPVINNFLTSTTIQFRNFDTLLFGNEVLPVYSLVWDTIENLPPGLCWSTNKPNNTFSRGEGGCIHIRGLACGPTGQYKLSTLVTVDIGVPVETDGDPGGLKYFIRLQNPGDVIMPGDTSQTDSMTFMPYGGICQNLTPLSVSLGGDQTVCQGSIVTFNPSVTGGQPPYTYRWQYIGSSIGCPTCMQPTTTVTTNSTYMLVASDASGKYGSDTVQYLVTGNPYNFQISAPEPSSFCGGGSVTISGNANNSLTFQWYNGSNVLSGDTTNTITVTDVSGGYFLLYSEPGGCHATSNIIHLLFYDTTFVSIVSLNSDTFCLGGSTTLVANTSVTGLSYAWLANGAGLNNTTQTLVSSNPGFYQVVVTNASGCIDTSAGVLLVASSNFPPTITYAQFASYTVCNNAAPINLYGGQPAGGYYSGYGVLDTVFNPYSSRPGVNLIYYNYTDSTGCGGSVADSIDVLLCTMLQNPAAELQIKLFPNPATNNLIVQSVLLRDDNITFTVYDIFGNKVNVPFKTRSDVQASLDVAGLANDCYILQIKTKDNQATVRFMKID